MSILYLNQPSTGHALPVLLRLLENKGVAGYRPSLCYLWQWYGTTGRQVEVVGRAESEIGHEFQVAHGEGAELQVGDGDAVGRCSAHGLKIEGLDASGEAWWCVGGLHCWWKGNVAFAGEMEVVNAVLDEQVEGALRTLRVRSDWREWHLVG